MTSDKTFSRNRYFEAMADPEFAKAKKIATMLRSIAEECRNLPTGPRAYRVGDNVIVSYELNGSFRESTLNEDEWSILSELLGVELKP